MGRLILFLLLLFFKFINYFSFLQCRVSTWHFWPIEKAKWLACPKEVAEAFSDITHFVFLCSSATYPMSFRERLLSYSGSYKKTDMDTPEGDIDMLHNSKWMLVPGSWSSFQRVYHCSKTKFSLINANEVSLNPNGNNLPDLLSFRCGRAGSST